MQNVNLNIKKHPPVDLIKKKNHIYHATEDILNKYEFSNILLQGKILSIEAICSMILHWHKIFSLYISMLNSKRSNKF